MTALLLLTGAGLILTAALLAAGIMRARRQDGIVLSERLGLLAPAAITVPAEEVPWFDWAKARIPAFLQRDIARADVEITARAVILYCGLLPLVAVAGGLAIGALGAVIAVVIGIVGPALYIRYLASRRLAAFTTLLPHYLDSIRQLLLVGNSFQQALTKSTDGSSPPVQRYLQPAIRRINNGAPVVDALEMVANRIDLPEWHMVVAAVRTNARFGGSVAPTLAGVVRLLRDRARVMRELGAASAETRMSALVLCALPPVALLVISLINYGYMRYLWETSAGRHLLAVGLAFQTVGMLTMRRLMRLDF